nr:hypothetical protein [Tanacetum cinerariifolium]
MVSYTEVSSPFEDLSDIGSSGVDGLLMMPHDPYDYVEAALQAPPSLDYVPGAEHLPTSEFVSKHVYPAFMPPEDDVLPAEEQPLLAVVSPTTDSPGYILKSDPEEDDEDPKEDPADYLTDRDDDDEDEEEESYGDEADNEEEDEDEDKEDEEEEHPALADSIPPPPTSFHTITSTITTFSIVITTTLDSLTTITSITTFTCIIPPLPSSPTYPLGYRVAMIQLRAEAPSTSNPPPPIVLPHTRASVDMLRDVTPSTYILTPRLETPPSGTPPLLPIPLPTSSPPLILPSTSHKVDVLE